MAPPLYFPLPKATKGDAESHHPECRRAVPRSDVAVVTKCPGTEPVKSGEPYIRLRPCQLIRALGGYGADHPTAGRAGTH